MSDYFYYSTDNGATLNKIPFRSGLSSWNDIGGIRVNIISYNVNFMLIISQTYNVVAINNLYYGGYYTFV